MEGKIEQKKSFKETYVVLKGLGLYQRLPRKFQELIENNMDNNHEFSFDKNIQLFDQITNTFTRNLLTYIYITYINTDENIDKYFDDEVNEILKLDNFLE